VLQVELATELSTSSAQISNLQLELADFRKREGELKQKLQSTSSTTSENKEELDRLRLQREGEISWKIAEYFYSHNRGLSQNLFKYKSQLLQIILNSDYICSTAVKSHLKCIFIC